jgi:hypothetical protein
MPNFSIGNVVGWGGKIRYEKRGTPPRYGSYFSSRWKELPLGYNITKSGGYANIP